MEWMNGLIRLLEDKVDKIDFNNEGTYWEIIVYIEKVSSEKSYYFIDKINRFMCDYKVDYVVKVLNV